MSLPQFRGGTSGGAAEAIDWLCRAFRFEVGLKIEDEEGCIACAALPVGDWLVAVADASRVGPPRIPPYTSLEALDGVRMLGLFDYGDDIDAHSARVRAAGTTIVTKPWTLDYGDERWDDRSYGRVDPGGYYLWFVERERDLNAPRT